MRQDSGSGGNKQPPGLGVGSAVDTAGTGCVVLVGGRRVARWEQPPQPISSTTTLSRVVAALE